MARARNVFTVGMELPKLGALAMLVAVNRLTSWGSPRPVWQPKKGWGMCSDPHLEEILDEMEDQGDELADTTIKRLYDCAGVRAVQAANRMMQERFDKKWKELCGERATLDPKESEDEGEKVCRLMETQKPVRRLTRAQRRKIRSIIKEYIQKSSRAPDWIDKDLIEKGEEAFENHGMLGFAVLACGSLPTGYAAPEAAKVLGFTQKLHDASVSRRRLIETSLFIMAVKEKGGLKFPDGEGILAIQSVRLMHAGVRYLLRKTPNEKDLSESRELSHLLLEQPWDEKTDGVPINQVIMCATILCFSYISLRCFRQMGIQLSEEQERGYLHCWNVAAHVMGVKDKLLLERGNESMEEAENLFNSIWKRHGARISDGVEKLEGGRVLTQALLTFLESPFKPEGKSSARVRLSLLGLPVVLPLEHAPRMLIRQLIGERGTELLGVKLTPLQRFLHWVVSPTLQRLPDLRRRHPRLYRLKKMPSEEVAEQIFRGMLVYPEKNFPREGRPPFRIPVALAKRLGIEEMTTPVSDEERLR